MGILLDSFDTPAWAASAIRRIAQGHAAEFALVIMNAGVRSVGGDESRSGIYSLFDRLDRRLFGRQPDPLALTSIKTLLADVPSMTVQPVPLAAGCGLNELDVLAIREYRLDIVIRIGFDCLSCDRLRLAKYGIWYYYHGDDTRMQGGPSGFWEVVEGQPETGTSLLATGAEKYPCRVLYRSYFFTYPLSPARHRSHYFWAAASFLPRQVEALHYFGEEEFWRQTGQFNVVVPSPLKYYEVPSGVAALKAIGTIMVRMLSESFKRLLFLDQWFLLFSLDRGISDGFRAFGSLLPPKDRFWADPHIVRQDGKYYIFIEEWLHANNKGHISVIELDESGRWKAPVKILEQPYHLSYPFVFESDGSFYMVPETGGNRTIDLYKSISFPYKWEFKETLVRNVKAVDTTLLHYCGKWWLFTAIAEQAAAAPNVELFLFHSDQLLGGQWEPHPRNPIVSDIKRARPAGAVFLQDGKLIRPSQNCSVRYGYGFDLNEIVTLSESEYCERPICSVRPDWDKNVLATHTYANHARLTVIDAFRYVRRLG